MDMFARSMLHQIKLRQNYIFNSHMHGIYIETIINYYNIMIKLNEIVNNAGYSYAEGRYYH